VKGKEQPELLTTDPPLSPVTADHHIIRQAFAHLFCMSMEFHVF